MSNPDEKSDTTTKSTTQVDSASESSKSRNGFAAGYSKVCEFFGFRRGYNFPLWVIFAGSMLGFSLSRLPDLDYDGHFKNEFALVPGYWYFFHAGHYRYAMIIHLATILPAGLLMVLQVTPIIRYKFITFHRINGYIVSLLALISNAAVFVVIRHNQGGHRMGAQSAEYLMGILTTIGIVMAIINIRRKQIDQHRAWMLRTWFWMGVTISSRLINLAASPIITRIGQYWSVWSCDEISFLYINLDMAFPKEIYPQCFLSNGTLDAARRVAVRATEDTDILPELGSCITVTFGTMLWICLVLHTVGVELYLAMTPREAERLRRVSYEKQLEAGYRNPGSAGLVLDRWGDAEPWKPSK